MPIYVNWIYLFSASMVKSEDIEWITEDTFSASANIIALTFRGRLSTSASGGIQ